MTVDIILGRPEAERKKFGTQGSIFIAKQYIKMGQFMTLANKVFLDVTKTHVIFICGKRGGGKSYSLGILAEGISELEQDIAKNLSCVIVDTMGIFWTMKYPNHKEETLLKQWDLEGKACNVQIFTPVGYFQEYKEKGIPTDYPFAVQPKELTAEDWCLCFGISLLSPLGVLIEKTISLLQEREKNYSLDDIIKVIEQDIDIETETKAAAKNRFYAAEKWGLFSTDATLIDALVVGGKTTILDVSCYTEGWNVKALVIGLVAEKLFLERLRLRKEEELQAIESVEHFLREERRETIKKPLVWLLLDEAHEFLPQHGKNAATDALVTILREGRQPGISLVLASQQPGKIHTDVMTQADVVLCHRITAKMDVDALGQLAQSYLRTSIDKELQFLPAQPGAALVMDDQNERISMICMRPRFSWHGGEAPTLLEEKKPFL